MEIKSVVTEVIFALDCADEDKARHWVDKLRPEVAWFKVGLELFLAAGWSFINYIQQQEAKVMLDLKFLDIPTTVTKAVEQCVGRGISFITVHGYEQTIAAAVAGRGQDSMKILAVTLLTSQRTDQEDTSSTEELVLTRAKNSLRAGCDGLVTSPLEVAMLRHHFGDEAILVTPGIRDREDLPNEQQRTSGVTEAVAAGSDYLVIGRPIRLADDPLAKVRLIKHEIVNAI